MTEQEWLLLLVLESYLKDVEINTDFVKYLESHGYRILFVFTHFLSAGSNILNLVHITKFHGVL